MFSPVSQPKIFYDTKNIRSFFMTKTLHLKNHIIVMMLYRAGTAQPYTCIIKRKTIQGLIEIYIIEDKINLIFTIV
jgi:hypothetical protein